MSSLRVDAFVCCDENQIETMHANLLKAAGIYSRCPSCFRNFFNIFCEMTCSPTQSEFLEVMDTKSSADGGFSNLRLVQSSYSTFAAMSPKDEWHALTS